MPNQYALLIAVDFYYEFRLPDGTYYPKLGGCVRDVRHVETFLTDPSGMALPAENVLRLSATNNGGSDPVEPPDQRPTYENMVAKFKQVTAMAQPGDQVYVHYSGHGGRAVTVYPELKGAGAVDEALVPLDIGDPQSRYLRDVEIHKLIQDMVDKGLVLTIVFDSCHSGGATRAVTQGTGGAVARGIAKVDTTVRPAASLVASAAELAAAWTGAGGATRSAKPASGWLLEPRGYTLLAACRANESAYEYPFSGHESNGALTYWLLDTLRQGSPNLTYKQLHDRILAKVHGQFENQTPMLQGLGDVRVFGSERIPSVYAVLVRKVDSSGSRVQIEAGEAHGLRSGAQLEVFVPGATDFSRVGERVALVEIDQLGAVDSWAKVVEKKPGANLEAGSPAVLVNATTLRLQRGVIVDVAPPSLKQEVEDAIEQEGKGFIAVAGDAVPVDFQVTIDAQGEWLIQDAGDQPIPNLRPAIRADAADASGRLVQRLVHLAKYRNVQELDVPDPAMREKIEVGLSGVAANRAEGEVPVFRPGDMVKLIIKNTQQPNSFDPNDPARVLNVTVLDLQSDWGITQIYPANAGAFEPVDPGKSIDLEFESYLPEGYTDSKDVLKVFATRGTTQFRWLELPALDQPDLRPKGTRSALTDPLERLLAGLTGEETTTRALKLKAGPKADAGWAVGQVELRVQA